MAQTKLEKYAEQLVDRVAEGEVGINEAIDDLNKRLEVFDRVKVHRDRLLSARRALLGVGSRTTSGGGSRVTNDEVAAWLGANGPATTTEMAAGMSTTDSVIRGHVNRNPDRFTKVDNKWQLRDPEAAVDNDEEDDDDE